MDFESYKWDVENEAEKLHHSLFGDSKVSVHYLGHMK